MDFVRIRPDSMISAMADHKVEFRLSSAFCHRADVKSLMVRPGGDAVSLFSEHESHGAKAASDGDDWCYRRARGGGTHVGW